MGAWELRCTAPVIDLRTSARRPVLFTHLASLVLGVLMFMNLLVTTIQLQGARTEHGFGQSAARAGMAMLPSAVAILLVAPLSSRLARRHGARFALAVGAVVALAAYALRGFLSPNAGMVTSWTTLASIGIAIGYATLPMLIIANVEPHETAAANGLNALLRVVGTAVASAFVSAVGTTLATGPGASTRPSWEAIAGIFAVGSVLSVVTLVFALAVQGRRKPNRAREVVGESLKV